MNVMRFAVLASVAIAASTTYAQEGAPPVGYINIERAIQSVEDGQQAIQELQEQLESRQSALDSTSEELRELTEQLEQELVVLGTTEREERLGAYQQRVLAYQEQYLANQQELLELEQEAMREIVERMVAVVEEIATERGLSMVLERTRSNVVWAAEEVDLTDELIRRYEERY